MTSLRRLRIDSRLRKGIGVASIAALASGLLGTTGCTFGPRYERPADLTAEEWRSLSNGPYIGEPDDQVDWWTRLQDPVLDKLVQEAMSQNLSLQAASLRVVQARIARTGMAWSQFPLISGQASYSHSNLSQNVKPEVEVSQNKRSPRRNGAVATEIRNEIRNQILAASPDVSVSPELDVYDVSGSAMLELDLWGRKLQAWRSADQKLSAAYAAYDSIMVALAAEVARTYIQIRTTDLRLSAFASLLATMNEFTEITRERHEAGEALITDVRLAELLSGIVESSIPQLESNRRQLENALCVLLGRIPTDLASELGPTTALPTVPMQSVVGIPADLLRRRPDVRMAEHLAAAQCFRIGMAKANIMPSFNIFGALGFSSSHTRTLFESDSFKSTYGAGVNLTGLITYPVMVEFVRLEDARFQEAMLEYRDTVLNATREVEDSLYSLVKAREEVDLLARNVTAAQEAAELTLAAYKEGKVIISVPLTALSYLASQQDLHIDWQGQVATEYVAIYKGLGGGWETRVDQELVPEYIQEQMRKQADWWSFTGRRNLGGREKFPARGSSKTEANEEEEN